MWKNWGNIEAGIAGSVSALDKENDCDFDRSFSLDLLDLCRRSTIDCFSTYAASGRQVCWHPNDRLFVPNNYWNK